MADRYPVVRVGFASLSTQRMQYPTGVSSSKTRLLKQDKVTVNMNRFYFFLKKGLPEKFVPLSTRSISEPIMPGQATIFAVLKKFFRSKVRLAEQSPRKVCMCLVLIKSHMLRCDLTSNENAQIREDIQIGDATMKVNACREESAIFISSPVLQGQAVPQLKISANTGMRQEE